MEIIIKMGIGKRNGNGKLSVKRKDYKGKQDAIEDGERNRGRNFSESANKKKKVKRCGNYHCN